MQTARELAAQEFGVAVVTTAEDALLDALSRSLGLVLYYQARVKALQPEQLTQGTERITRTRKNPGGPDEVVEDVAVAKTAVNVYVRLLQEAELHHFRVAAKIAELQIEAGRVRLAREQGALMFELLARTLALVNIPVDDPRIVAGVPGIMGELTA
jgi:hypothetical protein